MVNPSRPLSLADSNVAVGPQVDRTAYLEREIERLMDLHESLSSDPANAGSLARIERTIARYDAMLGHDG